MKLTKLFLFFILFIALASTVTAPPPFISSGEFAQGLTLEFPLIEAIKINQTTEFHFHVFNTSNGVPIYNGLTCYFHLFNKSNAHQNSQKTNTAHEDFDFNFIVGGGNFSDSGEYSYLTSCNDSTKGGFVEGLIMVSTTGKTESEAEGLVLLAIMLGSIFVLLGCAFLFAYLYSNSDKLTKLLRLLYLGASMLCGIAAVGVVESLIRDNQNIIDASVAGSLGGMYSMVIWVFRIVMSMWLIYLVYSSAMALLGRREDTWTQE